jgi:Uma2 family endonuclease
MITASAFLPEPPPKARRKQLPRTVADVLHALGDIDANRILWQPLPGTATVKDAVRINESKTQPLVELVDGVLVEKPMGFPEALLATLISRLIGNLVEANNLGVVLGADGMLRLSPKLLRIPDVSYISWATLNGVIPNAAAPLIAPDLAVEVLSPGNTKSEMERKCREYFDAGTMAVWLVDPKKKIVTVHKSPENSIVLSVIDTLDGGDVLPGFSLNVKSLFGELDRKQK